MLSQPLNYYFNMFGVSLDYETLLRDIPTYLYLTMNNKIIIINLK